MARQNELTSQRSNFSFSIMPEKNINKRVKADIPSLLDQVLIDFIEIDRFCNWYKLICKLYI